LFLVWDTRLRRRLGRPFCAHLGRLSRDRRIEYPQMRRLQMRRPRRGPMSIGLSPEPWQHAHTYSGASKCAEQVT
jgi:hypothetical protein